MLQEKVLCRSVLREHLKQSCLRRFRWKLNENGVWRKGFMYDALRKTIFNIIHLSPSECVLDKHFRTSAITNSGAL